MSDPGQVLILTDHSRHSAENSLYAMINAMICHPHTKQLYVASRANQENRRFFDSYESGSLKAACINHNIAYNSQNHPFEQGLIEIDPHDFNFIWLRMPPPLELDFLRFLDHHFSHAVIINDPMGIYETGSKAFLAHFSELTAPMKVCSSTDDIESFRAMYHDIILKPNRNYGGIGLVRITGDTVHYEDQRESYSTWISSISQDDPLDLTAVRFLTKVHEGDKRIIVVNGHVIGASLRLPPKGSWICNVAMGGSSNPSTITPEEYEIIEVLNPVLYKKGIVMYGIDTLVGDDGYRVLSEINTTSIGGLPQMAKMNNQPLVEQTIDEVWKYVINKLK